MSADERENYLSALLLDINGWASWCAYLRWTARLAGQDDHHLLELLSIRVGWEWILLRSGGDELRADWRHALASWPAFDHAAQSARADDWILQRAVEIAWTSQVRRKLPEGFGAARPSAPTVQAVFCLDVRSEVFVRALEVVADAARRARGPLDVGLLGVAYVRPLLATSLLWGALSWQSDDGEAPDFAGVQDGGCEPDDE